MSEPQHSDREPTRYGLPANLIHDLRSPLNLIIGYSELMIQRAAEEEQNGFVPDLEKVCTAGRKLLEIINDNLVATEEGKAVVPARVPVALSEGEASNEMEGALEGFASGVSQGLLLVVDDDEANRDMLSRRLEREGYVVARAENGRQALDMMHERVFDLVLLDIMMPEMDGYEVLKRLKEDEILHHTPVIVISALSELNAVVRCIEMGAVDHLPKPIDSVRLKARVKACLEKKRGHDREAHLFEQLQASHYRLQELERQRDDLTHMIVHDLRTPLTSVIAGMQTLEGVGDLNEVQKEMVDIAVTGGETLLGMISDLLDVEKLESGSMQPSYTLIKAVDLVDSALAQVTSLAHSRDLALVREVPPDLPDFEGDIDTLRRTLVNLLGNSIKFTPAGGSLTVSVALEEDALLFSVRDTGEGIPEEAFERIFEKFGQVESRKAGRKMSTGLGLTFCKLTVRAHGGDIRVHSTPGQGSTFSFTIPLWRGHPAATA